MDPGMMSMLPPPMIEVSSVPIEKDLDNHKVEAEVCAAWLKSEVGQEMKKTNPAAYLNVLLHKKEHDQAAMQKELEQMMAMTPPPTPGREEESEEIAPVNG